MAQQARWKNYTKEEIQKIWYDSLTKKDFCTTLGYKSAGHVLEIQEYYSLDNKDLGKNNPNQKKYMIGPKGTKIEDLRGQNFGHWLVIDIDNEKTKQDYQHSWWICECDCENHTRRSITMNNLKRGLTQSCGCKNTSILTENMIGKRFGKLTVLEINTLKHSKRGKVLKCQCDCGNYIDVVSTDLKNNHTSSCGCMTSKGEFLISKILKNMNIPFQ